MTRALGSALTPLIASCHAYDYVGAPDTVHHGMPSRTLTLVLAFDNPLEIGPLQSARRGSFWTTAAGLSSSPVGIGNGGRQVGVQIAIHPTASRTLFGVPASALAGEIVGLEDLVGDEGQRLYDEVAAAGSWPCRRQVLEGQLARLQDRQVRQDRAGRVSPSLHWAWQELSRRDGRVTVQWLADAVGWSRRHFTERFRAEFGQSPKTVARIMRFERSRRLVSSGVALAAVADACGYADQAHLTRDWQALAGLTPGQWRRRELPFLQDIEELC